MPKFGQALCNLLPFHLLLFLTKQSEAQNFSVLGLGGASMPARPNAQATDHILVQIPNGKRHHGYALSYQTQYRQHIAFKLL